MLRRRSTSGSRGPGLARTVARTAVIAGTATATSNAVHNRQQQRHQAATADANQLQEQVSALQSEQLASDIQHAPNARQDFVTQLQQLGELRTQGILTEDEFGRAKAKLLDM